MSKFPGSSGRTERIGQLLFVATQAAQTLATEQLQPLGLSARGWGVLSTLAESGPLTQIELAMALAIDRTAMVYLLDELEQSGLAERVRNPDDRRSFLIHLTGEGQSTQRKAATALAGAADTLLRPLDPEERDLLRALLTTIVDHWQALSAAQPQRRQTSST
jgi:DNA-binding MarR family transcriptional regulator